MLLVTELRRRLKARIRRWTLARQPAARCHTLTQNRIFILPTKAGCAWLLVLLMMLVMAVNYENNLIYALTFLLLGVFLSAIFHTYANLAGIRVRTLPSEPCFAGTQATFELELQRQGSSPCERLQLRLEHSAQVAVVDLMQESQVLHLYCPARQRGWLSPGGLKVESCYPLGLFRAWSWLNLEMKNLIYPAPIETPVPATVDNRSPHGQFGMTARRGDDDFAGLERFQSGMSPRHVDWKSYARGRGLHAKHFAGHQNPDLWLDLDALGGEALERRLSRLTAWVQALSASETRFGMRLGGFELPPARGEAHRAQALSALALYGLEEKA